MIHGKGSQVQTIRVDLSGPLAFVPVVHEHSFKIVHNSGSPPKWVCECGKTVRSM